MTQAALFAAGSRHPAGHRCTCQPDRLTETELRIVAGLAAGKPLADIGEAVHHAPTTVATYVTRARAKVGARDRAHLVAIAFRDRLIAFDPKGDVVVTKQALAGAR